MKLISDARTGHRQASQLKWNENHLRIAIETASQEREAT